MICFSPELGNAREHALVNYIAVHWRTISRYYLDTDARMIDRAGMHGKHRIRRHAYCRVCISDIGIFKHSRRRGCVLLDCNATPT